MTVFVHVHDDRSFPAEEKISEAGTQDNGDAEPSIEGHEDEHKEVTNCHLDHVEEGLDAVTPAQKTRSAGWEKNLIEWLCRAWFCNKPNRKTRVESFTIHLSISRVITNLVRIILHNVCLQTQVLWSYFGHTV